MRQLRAVRRRRGLGRFQECRRRGTWAFTFHIRNADLLSWATWPIRAARYIFTLSALSADHAGARRHFRRPVYLHCRYRPWYWPLLHLPTPIHVTTTPGPALYRPWQWPLLRLPSVMYHLPEDLHCSDLDTDLYCAYPQSCNTLPRTCIAPTLTLAFTKPTPSQVTSYLKFEIFSNTVTLF